MFVRNRLLLEVTCRVDIFLEGVDIFSEGVAIFLGGADIFFGEVGGLRNIEGVEKFTRFV